MEELGDLAREGSAPRHGEAEAPAQSLVELRKDQSVREPMLEAERDWDRVSRLLELRDCAPNTERPEEDSFLNWRALLDARQDFCVDLLEEPGHRAEEVRAEFARRFSATRSRLSANAVVSPM